MTGRILGALLGALLAFWAGDASALSVNAGGAIFPQFTPQHLPGLVRAWRADVGISTDGNGITSAAGAWGTASAATASGTNEPDLAAATSPRGAPMFQFTSSRSEAFNFPSITLTKFTLVVAVAPADCATAAKPILGRQAASTTVISLTTTCTSLSLRGTTNPATVTQTLPAALPANNVSILIITYDGTVATGTINTYVNCVATATPATGMGDTFTIDRLGANTTPNYWNGLIGEPILFNRVLGTGERTKLCGRYAGLYRPKTLYVSASSGSDSSTTPWFQSAPLLSPATAVSKTRDGQTAALKKGDRFRIVPRLQPAGSGVSAAAPNRLSGAIWGSGDNPQIVYATAPTCTVTTGTVYDCGAWVSQGGSDIPPTPGASFGYIFYVPGGGAPTWGGSLTGYETTNVVQLTQQSATPTAPASGKWGYDSGGAGHLFVNAGVALSAGEIEVPVTPGGIHLAALIVDTLNYWEFEDFDILYPNGYCAQARSAWPIYRRVRALFCQADALTTAAHSPADGTGQTIISSVITRAGSAPTTSGSFGDGISCHDDSGCIVQDTISAYNDKSAYSVAAGATATGERSMFVGPQAINFATPAGAGDPCGSFTVTNSIIALPSSIDAAQKPVAVETDSYYSGGGVCLLTIQNNTIYSFSAAAGRKALDFSSAGAAHSTTLKWQNNITKGFDTALLLGSGVVSADLTHDHNLYHGNNTNYTGVSGGTGDVLADPLFVSAGTNFALQGGSPAKAAGGFLAGVLTDFLATTRANPPSIGAYE